MAAATIAAACGGSTDQSQDDVTDEPVPEVGDESDEGTDPDDALDPAELTPQEAILAAFSDLGSGVAFRSTMAQAQSISIPALGVDNEAQLDPERPMMTIEVAVNGDSSVYLDMGPTLSAISGGDQAVVAALDDVHAELWIVGDVLTIDATGYQPLADLAPDYPLGPFAPGIGTVDLAAMGELGGDDLITVMTGSVVDPVTLAVTLPASLVGVERDASDPNRYTATVPYDDLLRAQGADPEINARTMAVSMAPLFGGDVDAAAEVFRSYLETVVVDVELAIADGVLASMGTTADLSGIFAALVGEGSPLVDGLSDSERREVESIMGDAVQILETLTTFELDDSIVIAPPAGEFEDRTQLAIEFATAVVAG